jgi:flagellar biosynthesis/type III secretory pathway chaperone
MDHGMGRSIAWAGALLSQERHSLSSSALYSRLQNILAHKAFILKCFTKKKQLNIKKRKKHEKYWPKLSKKRLVHVKNCKHINRFILNIVIFIRRF